MRILFIGRRYYQVLGKKSKCVVSATRQVRQKLTKEDIVATADIKEMDTSTGLVPIKISIPNYAGKYESAEAAPRNLQIQRGKIGKESPFPYGKHRGF